MLSCMVPATTAKNSFTPVLLLALFMGVFFAGDARAATLGNTAASEATQFNIDEGPPGSGVQNSTEGLLQTFSTSASFWPESLTLYLAEVGAADGDLLVSLCLNPDRTGTDPCTTGAASVMEEWTISDGGLPTEFPVTTATTLDIDDDTLGFFPGMSYGLWIRRTASANSIQAAYTTGDYADGDVYDTATGNVCTPEWIYTSANSPGSCSATDTRDLRFHFTDTGQTLTINVHQNGPQTWFNGLCVEQENLPPSWTLFSNQVHVEAEQTDASASATFLAASVDCENGAYETYPVEYWDGEWLFTARQAGSPVSYEASATATVSGSSNTNPLEEIAGCYADQWWLLCAVQAAYRNILTSPPFSWLTDILDAFTAEPEGLEDGAWQDAGGAALLPSDWSDLATLGATSSLEVQGEPLITFNLDPASDTSVWAEAAEVWPFRGYLVWGVYFLYLWTLRRAFREIREIIA